MDEKQTKLRELFEKHREIIMYLIFGVVTSVVSWVIYSLCIILFRGFSHIQVVAFGLDIQLYIFLANVVSWIIAVSVAFVTNKLWVFDSRSWEGKLVRKEAVTFVGGRALTGVLEIGAVTLLAGVPGFDATLFGIETLPAKILIAIIVVILNYLISKFISFKPKGSKA